MRQARIGAQRGGHGRDHRIHPVGAGLKRQARAREGRLPGIHEGDHALGLGALAAPEQVIQPPGVKGAQLIGESGQQGGLLRFGQVLRQPQILHQQGGILTGCQSGVDQRQITVGGLRRLIGEPGQHGLRAGTGQPVFGAAPQQVHARPVGVCRVKGLKGGQIAGDPVAQDAPGGNPRAQRPGGVAQGLNGVHIAGLHGANQRTDRPGGAGRWRRLLGGGR